jgi:hypothetical protein
MRPTAFGTGIAVGHKRMTMREGRLESICRSVKRKKHENRQK